MSQRISGIVLLATSVYLYWVSLAIQVPSRLRGPEPSGWPRLLLILLCILSVLLIITSFRRTTLAKMESAEPADPRGALRAFGTIVACGAYSVFLESVGFIVTTVILLPVLMFLFGGRKLWMYFVVPVPVTMVIAVLFGMLGIVMPMGEGVFRSISVLVLQR